MRLELRAERSQARSDVLERAECYLCEGSNGMVRQVLARRCQRLGNTTQAQDDGLLTGRVERRGLEQRFEDRAECLVDVKIRIAPPAADDIQLPTQPRQRRTDQPIVDLLFDWPAAA